MFFRLSSERRGRRRPSSATRKRITARRRPPAFVQVRRNINNNKTEQWTGPQTDGRTDGDGRRGAAAVRNVTSERIHFIVPCECVSVCECVCVCRRSNPGGASVGGGGGVGGGR